MDDEGLGSEAMVPSNQRPFNFLGLPKELRLNVYDYTLRPHTLRIYSYERDSVQDDTNDQLARTVFWTEPSTMEVWPQLLRTCKVIHDEAENILFSPSNLDLCPSFAEGGPDENDALFDATKLFRIHRLEQLKLELIATARSRTEDVMHSRILKECISPGATIGKVVVRIRDTHSNEYIPGENRPNLNAMLEVLNTWNGVLKSANYEVLVIADDDVEIEAGWSKTGNGPWEAHKPAGECYTYQSECLYKLLRCLMADGNQAYDPSQYETLFEATQKILGHTDD